MKIDKMSKDQEQLVKMIFSLVNISEFDINISDSKYLLSNMIAKYSNSGKIFLSEKAKNTLEDLGHSSKGEVKYQSKFYGKSSSFYKRHRVQFVVEHVIPCSVLLNLILSSDKSFQGIKKILDSNRVVMLLKEENDTLNSLGLSSKVAKDFSIENEIWGRYNNAGILVSDNYFVNTGPIFR